MINEIIIDGVRYTPEMITPKNDTPFGEMLRRFREGRRWTLDWAASQAGISKTYLWELETGKVAEPSFRVAARLAKLYCISLPALAASLDVASPPTEEVKP